LKKNSKQQKKTDKFKNTNLDDLDSEYQRELDSIKKFADEIETIPKFQTFSTASAPPLPGSSDFIEKLSNDKNERNRLLENAEYHKISTWDMLIKDIGLSKASESTKEKSTKEESKSPNFNPTELETPPTTSRSNFKYRWLLALGVGGLILYLLLNQTDENKTLDSIPFFSFRFLRSAITAIKIGADYKFALWSGTTDFSKVHKRSADSLLHLFKSNGGIFIKAGQIMTGMSYALPPEYIETMQPLFDEAPTMSETELFSVFLSEFGKYPSEIFDSFDSNPIASASLAQVHKAVYKRQQVAVKVQFPIVFKNCLKDIQTIDTLINAIAFVLPEFKLKWLVDEFNRNLPKELDFLQEAKNTSRVRENFKNSKDLQLPKTIWELTNKKILTMEFINGCKITDLEALKKMKISPEQVAYKLQRIFSKQIFIDGYVHADPHPGNIFVKKVSKSDFVIVLVDNGLYKEYSNEFRMNYSHLWLAILKGDEKEIQHYCKKLGAKSHKLLTTILTTRPWETVATKKLNTTLSKEERDSLLKTAATESVQITQLLNDLEEPLLLLFKINDMLRTIYSKLGASPERLFFNNLSYCQSVVRSSFFETFWLTIQIFSIQFYMWIQSFFQTSKKPR